MFFKIFVKNTRKYARKNKKTFIKRLEREIFNNLK
jgi:hypothetical protein